MCKIPWNSDAFLPLCCLVDLWRYQTHVLPPGTHTPIHQFSEYLPEKWDLTSWYSCRRRENLLLRLKGCWMVRSGHFRRLVLWDSLDFWRRLYTGRHGPVPSGGRKRPEMVEIVDLDIAEVPCGVWFIRLYIFIVAGRLFLFSAHRQTLGLISFFYFCNEL